MKRYLLFSLMMFTSLFVFASGDPQKLANKFTQKQTEINDQMFKIQEIDRILKDENLTYQQLAEKYPDLVNSTNLAPTVDDGIFDKAADSPLGIPGFWWGFCLAGAGLFIPGIWWGFSLGIAGILIVYLSMDEGEERKEQVKNALIGCLVASGIGIIITLLILGVLFAGTVDATNITPFNIATSC